MNNSKNMYIFINTFLLLVTIIWINFYIFAWNDFLFLLFLSFIFLFLFLFLIYKQKNIYIFIIPCIIVFMYGIIYTYIYIDTIENNSLIIEQKNSQMTPISFENQLWECLEKIDCDISFIFWEQKEKITTLISSGNSIWDIFTLESYLVRTLQSKEQLIALWVWNNFSLSFEKDNYIKNILNGEYNNQLQRVSSIKNNLFFTHTTFSEFIKMYYSDVYKAIIKNNFEDIEKKYSKSSFMSQLLNRKYLYNNMIFPHTYTFTQLSQKWEKIEKLIQEINE